MSAPEAHVYCSVYEPCEVGDPSGCPHESTRTRRACESQGYWSRLEMRRDVGGNRHYLDDEPIHCGAVIELQSIAYRSDDYGEYKVPLQEGVLVRYEAQLQRPEPVATLHKSVGGYEFVAAAEPWMPFRWPRGGSR